MSEHESELRKSLAAAYSAPESLAVGKAELMRLSQRSAMAIAYRSVLRAKPLFTPYPDDAQREIVNQVFIQSLDFVRRFIADEEMNRGNQETLETASRQVYEHGVRSGKMVAFALSELVSGVGYSSADDAEMVISCAATALMTSIQDMPMREEERCVSTEKMLKGQVNDIGLSEGRDAAASDYEMAIKLNLGSYPGIGGPIDPTEIGQFGSLWQDQVPAWYK